VKRRVRSVLKWEAEAAVGCRCLPVVTNLVAPPVDGGVRRGTHDFEVTDK
jgi:hypothetical protein